jgi:hypothetical protein
MCGKFVSVEREAKRGRYWHGRRRTRRKIHPVKLLFCLIKHHHEDVYRDLGPAPLLLNLAIDGGGEHQAMAVLTQEKSGRHALCTPLPGPQSCSGRGREQRIIRPFWNRTMESSFVQPAAQPVYRLHLKKRHKRFSGTISSWKDVLVKIA